LALNKGTGGLVVWVDAVGLSGRWWEDCLTVRVARFRVCWARLLACRSGAIFGTLKGSNGKIARVRNRTARVDLRFAGQKRVFFASPALGRRPDALSRLI